MITLDKMEILVQGSGDSILRSIFFKVMNILFMAKSINSKLMELRCWKQELIEQDNSELCYILSHYSTVLGILETPEIPRVDRWARD